MNDDFFTTTDGSTAFSSDSNDMFDTNSTTGGSALTDDMVTEAANAACNFFGIEEVPVVNAESTCMWPNDASTYADDVIGFNREELTSLGINDEDSLMLTFTHECAHRTLQNTYTDDWKEELACDFFAGVHAGMKDVDIDKFEAAFGATEGGTTHPNGALRADFIEYGKQIAEEMKARGVEITYERCIARLNDHLEEKGDLISEYRQHFNPESLSSEGQAVENKGVKHATMADVEYSEHQARITSGSEQAHWIKDAKWKRDHLDS